MAGELGTLANNTKQSLRDIHSVIERISKDTDLTTEQLDISSGQLSRQSTVLEQTVEAVRGMLTLIREAAKVHEGNREAESAAERAVGCERRV